MPKQKPEDYTMNGTACQYFTCTEFLSSLQTKSPHLCFGSNEGEMGKLENSDEFVIPLFSCIFRTCQHSNGDIIESYINGYMPRKDRMKFDYCFVLVRPD